MAQDRTAAEKINAPAETPQPGPEHKRLNAFLGRWNTEGETQAGPSGPAATIKAVDTYDWLPGGFFLVHRWIARIGDLKTEGIEIIGYDDSSGTYPMHSFDNQGNAGVMEASVRGNVWIFKGETERFTGEFSEDGQTLTVRWERSSDGLKWEPWMHVKLTKAA